MQGKIHPYYAAIQRIVDAHPDHWTISSLATEAKLDISTIRKAIEAGSAPSIATIKKIEAVIGLDYEGVLTWRGEALEDAQKGKELRELREIAARASKDDRERLLDLARRLDTSDSGPPEAEAGDDEG